MAISNIQVQNTAQAIVTVPVDKSYVVTTLIVVNTAAPDPADDSAGATTLTMHVVNNGGTGSISNTNMVVNALPITAGESFVMDTEKFVLEAGDSIVLLSTTPNNLAATLSYVEI